jgi:hypothetical protein
MKVILYSASCLLLTGLAGCGAFSRPAQDKTEIFVTKAGVDVVSYTGTLRGAYVLPPGSQARFCAEPAPDVSLDTLKEIAANLKATAETVGSVAKPAIEGGIESKITTKALELQGRTALVVLARDLLYRLCELSLNHPPDSEAYKAAATQYTQVLEVIQVLAAADQASAHADLLRAQMEATRILADTRPKVARIMAHVRKADGTIDAAKLRALADRLPNASTSLKNYVASLIDPVALEGFLETTSPALVGDLSAGIP